MPSGCVVALRCHADLLSTALNQPPYRRRSWFVYWSFRDHDLTALCQQALPGGDPCEAQHWHGFIGMEHEVVDQIAGWIKNTLN